MAFKNLEDILRDKGVTSSGTIRCNYDVAIAVHESKGNPRSFVIYISKKIMDQARFIKDDKVTILIDIESRDILIKRDPNGNRIIHSRKKRTNGKITFKYIPEMGIGKIPITPVETVVADNGILISLPEKKDGEQ